MKLILAAIGKLKAGPERELFDRYAERAHAMAGGLGLNLAFRESDDSRARTVDARRAEEARFLQDFAGKQDFAGRDAHLCALDERGASLTSPAWAADIARARDQGQRAYVVLIGGPDGLDPDLRKSARTTLAFGALTLPHQLVRVLAAEQIYRALTILAGHPYHRA